MIKTFRKLYKYIIFSLKFVSFIIDGCLYSFGIILAKIKVDFDASQGIVNLISALNTGFIFMSGKIRIKKKVHLITF
jgi:hypothetical protein